MDELTPIPPSDSSVMGETLPSWDHEWDPAFESMLSSLVDGVETGELDFAQEDTDEDPLLGLINGSFEQGTELEEGLGAVAESWLIGADAMLPETPSYPVLDVNDCQDMAMGGFRVAERVDCPGLDEIVLPDDGSLPALSSEVSSFVNDECFILDTSKCAGDSSDSVSAVVHSLASSPGTCSGSPAVAAAGDSTPSPPNSEEGLASSSRSPTLVGVNLSGNKMVASPGTGVSDSSDVGAGGRSCDNFADLLEKQAISNEHGHGHEDAKRQSRLMKNRESASQSRLRKKSYMKDLEAKCRAMESQLSMLHQTVAFTSAQNAALRDELAHVKTLKGVGSKVGGMEPAALPSDSLPSESPFRHISPCLSVKSELAVFLCHVLLLTLWLLALPLKWAPVAAPSGGNTRSETEGCFALPVSPVSIRQVDQFNEEDNGRWEGTSLRPSSRKKRGVWSGNASLSTMVWSLRVQELASNLRRKCIEMYEMDLMKKQSLSMLFHGGTRRVLAVSRPFRT